MDNIAQKAYFLRNEYIGKLQTIAPDMAPRWGKMNVQQMIEHMAEYIGMGRGNSRHTTIVTQAEHLEKYQQFLRSDKEFRENTPNVLMPDTPAPTKHESLEHALGQLKDEIDLLFKTFEDHPDKKVLNPIFGELDYEMTIQLLYKHAWHHLKQFGVME